VQHDQGGARFRYWRAGGKHRLAGVGVVLRLVHRITLTDVDDSL
jgi:hypothetical protein